MYTTSDTNKLYFILNGEAVTNPHNMVVESEDKLLIWYGTGMSEDNVITRYSPMIS